MRQRRERPHEGAALTPQGKWRVGSVQDTQRDSAGSLNRAGLAVPDGRLYTLRLNRHAWTLEKQHLPTSAFLLKENSLSKKK